MGAKAHKESSDTPSEPPNKQCLIHKKPHPLKRCRAFREKPLEERKSFLKENICFRCCDTSSHQARNCKAEIRCSECNSEKHIAVLHAGPAPWSAQHVSSTLGHGGEENMDRSAAEATSTCTQVCGYQGGGRSCSKICLVSVYPNGQPNKKIKAYETMDDQSNRSLAKSAFLMHSMSQQTT